MSIEVIVQNEQEAIQAEKMGAARLELVSSIDEGGLTPSFETIKQVLNSVTVPVQVMIRPHSRDFFYSDSEMNTIIEDVKNVLNLGGHGIVFGALTKDYAIDEQALEKVIAVSDQLDITFHRAFDEIDDQLYAYRALANYKKQVKRILTSGGHVDCLRGKNQLRKLVELSKEMEGPSILCGGGLTPTNIEEIHQTVRASEYHLGSGVRKNGSYAEGFDKEVMQQVTEMKA
ncbi:MULTISPECIES: copper homeostasis protein CutC [Planococcus]|uniref:PF03932 family protein CutC n=1 Tax=Planococcus faecalis TaxID=1598147 RepID=A0ABM6IWF3_9BACL|nr:MULTISPECIES: copper homeostasis protein CutC [Planococcus]AQU80736.1 copper homeostasis protein CutC [Planococcus faecalis]MDJ0331952.1 copper homeostasis protein CutC [Planococcus sp. S3-L1]OHX55727.1 copper homeostasis protein CutC [Planococcus faecalis]